MLKSLSSPFFWLRILLGAALAFASTGMLYYSMPPFGIWPLAFHGFVPMLVAQHRLLPKGLSGLAPAITIGGFWGWGILILVIFGALVSRVWFLQNLWLIVGVIVLVIASGACALHQRTGYRWFVLEDSLV